MIERLENESVGEWYDVQDLEKVINHLKGFQVTHVKSLSNDGESEEYYQVLSVDKENDIVEDVFRMDGNVNYVLDFLCELSLLTRNKTEEEIVKFFNTGEL